MSSNKGDQPRLQATARRGGRRTARHLDSVVYGLGDGMKSTECNGGASSGWQAARRDDLVPDHPGRGPDRPGAPPDEPGASRGGDRRGAGRRASPRAQGAASRCTRERSRSRCTTRRRAWSPRRSPLSLSARGVRRELGRPGTRRTAYYTNCPTGAIASTSSRPTTTASGTRREPASPSWSSPASTRPSGSAASGCWPLPSSAPSSTGFASGGSSSQKSELERLVAARTAEVEAANAALARLAREDGLTGVANRRTFDATLDEEWRRAHRLGGPLALDPPRHRRLQGLQRPEGPPGGRRLPARRRPGGGPVPEAGRRAGGPVWRRGVRGRPARGVLRGCPGRGREAPAAGARAGHPPPGRPRWPWW